MEFWVDKVKRNKERDLKVQHEPVEITIEPDGITILNCPGPDRSIPIITDAYICKIQKKINRRPRLKLNFSTSIKIHAGSNPLLMCTLYYVCFDHGLPRSAMALSKVSLGAKQISYIRESVKAIVEKLMETSVTNALDKKAEWTKQIKDVEDAELKQAMKNTLRDTKGKHGRRTFRQEEQSIDDILIADDKQALKEAILMALNDMEHEYETAYIKAALIRSHHLEPHTSFSSFLRAICTFSGRKYKYDSAQRVDTVIYHDEKEFMTSKSSKWQHGRRIVSYLTEVFRATQIQ